MKQLKHLKSLPKTHRNLSPDSRLGVRDVVFRAKGSVRLHDEDAVGGEAVDLVIRVLPLGGLLAQEDVARGVEPSRQDLNSAAVPLSQYPSNYDFKLA